MQVRHSLTAGFVAVVSLVLATGFTTGAAAKGAALSSRAIAADSVVVTNYSDPSISDPRGIAEGPDGAVWFTNAYPGSIGRITTDGAVTTYTDPRITYYGYPSAITAGPDGALWFTNLYGNSIGRITTNGEVSVYTSPSINMPAGITAGPDGALWFTNYSGHSIGRITTAGVVTAYDDPRISYPWGITAGPDGALWFANSTSVGRIAVDGAVTIFTDPAIIWSSGITTGPDGAVWFTNTLGVGRITTGGVVTTFNTERVNYPFAITAGSDGALWFVSSSGRPEIGRITTNGDLTGYTDDLANGSWAITAGPDGGVWFTNSWSDTIGRIGPIDTTPPALTVPTDFSRDAASPDGALVTYAASATDDIDPAPTVSCMPASGSLFPIGDTTVNCTATDESGNSASASFAVHVKGGAEQLADLAAGVAGLGPGKSLADKAAQAQVYLAQGQTQEACDVLTAFGNEVRAQSGKKIPAAQATALIADASRIRVVLGCMT